MPLVRRDVNLLPGRWRLTGRLGKFEESLRIGSVAVLAFYVLGVGGMFAYFGYLNIKKSDNDQKLTTVAAELAQYKQLEASEQILKTKTSYALSALTGQVNAGTVVDKTYALVPNVTVQLLTLSLTLQGKLAISGIASSPGALDGYFSNFEDRTGAARSIYNRALTTFDQSAGNKVSFSVNLDFKPESGRTEVATP